MALSRMVLIAAAACLAVAGPPNASHAAQDYATARAQLIAWGLDPAPIPRGGKFDQCGIQGEQALCKRYPELVDCIGMGADANTCRMVFVAHGRFFVVAAYGWAEGVLSYRAGTWANATDTKEIKSLLTPRR